MSVVEYIPAGPTTQRFHESNAFVRGLKGPVGSGKSVACCWELVSRAFRQRPSPVDGMRRTRAVAIRNTFPELKSTTLQTWLYWFPEKLFGKVKWDTPITHKVQLADDVELEVWFLAVDRPDDVKKLLSLEATAIWLNEARELPKAVLDLATSRVGRYPGAVDGGASWSGVIMDTNPPGDDHWWHELAEEATPEGFEFFDQPSGLSEKAENLHNLLQEPETLALPWWHPERRAKGRVYYERQSQGKTREWVKVYVHGEYGSTSDGRPVYPEFNRELHVAKQPLEAVPNQPLLLGWDFGLTPACVICQLMPWGQFKVLREVVSENMALSQFTENLVKPLLATSFPGYKVLSLVDPAGRQRAQTDGRSCYEILKKAGLNPGTARSDNGFVARREAVGGLLTRLVRGEPAITIDQSCKVLIKGLDGDYQFKRVQVSGEERYHDEPVKNLSSHVNDALQYVCLYVDVPAKKEKRRVHTIERYLAPSAAGY